MEAGIPPPASTIPPEVPDHILPYLGIFWQLSTCRAIGGMGGPGPIPWTAIDQYAVRMGIVDDELLYDDLIHFISKMDAEYLGITKEAIDRDQAANSSAPAASGRGKPSW